MKKNGDKGLTAIAIPVYKPFAEHSISERVSISNTFRKLGAHTFFVIAPTNLNLDDLVSFASNYNIDLNINRFGENYFKGLHEYSDLLLNYKFYKSFAGFSHLLICQPDAWVFSDDIIKWQQLNYSFVGAPFFEGWNTGGSYNFLGVGNGGFSLRNIEDSLRILSRLNRLFLFRQTIGSALFKKFRRTTLFEYLFKIKSQENLVRLLNGDTIHEDIAWGMWIPDTFKDFNVPIPEQAMYFAFEYNPSYLFKLTKEQLPFGCHAWEKYEPEFWSKHINLENPG